MHTMAMTMRKRMLADSGTSDDGHMNGSNVLITCQSERFLTAAASDDRGAGGQNLNDRACDHTAR